MRLSSATDVIKPAFWRTHEVLAQPFVWIRFLVITSISSLALPSIGLPDFLTRKFNIDNGSYEHQFGALTFSPTVKFFFIGIAIILGIAFVIIGLLTIFRVPFMLFDLVSGRRTVFRELWRETGSLALQMFGFLFCTGIAFSVFSGLLHRLVRQLPLWRSA